MLEASCRLAQECFDPETGTWSFLPQTLALKMPTFDRFDVPAGDSHGLKIVVTCSCKLGTLRNSECLIWLDSFCARLDLCSVRAGFCGMVVAGSKWNFAVYQDHNQLVPMIANFT